MTLGDGSGGACSAQGSILTVTSYATRTSPVLRGKWVLDNLLGAPPPPPPPERPGAEGHKAEGTAVVGARAAGAAPQEPGLRELPRADGSARLRARELRCHRQDGATPTAAAPVDASATLPDGTTFKGAAELRALLVSRREEFVTTVTEKLLTYALGRGVEYYDMPAVRANRAETRREADYRWSSIILGYRRKRAVSDEESRSHDHHEESTFRGGPCCADSARRWRCRSSTAWCRRCRGARDRGEAGQRLRRRLCAERHGDGELDADDQGAAFELTPILSRSSRFAIRCSC